VTEHANVTNPYGIFHITEAGKFANGTGMFKNAYGSLLEGGPFGPNVDASDKIQPTEGATGVWYTIAPAQGTICGLNKR